MPCPDSSSSIAIRLDREEKFVSFDFAKITCGREIAATTGYAKYCAGKTLHEIVALPYQRVAADLAAKDEEVQFILYLEWDSLRSAIAQYLGLEDKELDKERCQISAISYDEKGIEVAMTILPPKEMPKILPCSLAEKQSSVVSHQSSDLSED
jgi:hypothetical protein